MNVFTNRADLLGFISTHIVFKYIKRAITDDGQVENYGAFSKPSCKHDEPGWIVKVITKKGKTVYVSVICQEQYRIEVTEKAPLWEHWAGEGCDNTLYTGDHPDWYKELKEIEIG